MYKKIAKSALDHALKLANRIWYRYLDHRWKECTGNYFTEWARQHAGHCGSGCQVNGKITVTDPRLLTLGNNVHIGENCYFRTQGGIIIGDNTHLSSHVSLYSDTPVYEGERLPCGSRTFKDPVIIGRNVWVGMGVNVRPGVSIGEGAIVGHGVMVTRDVKPFEIVGGADPTPVGRRDLEDYTTLDGKKLYAASDGRPWKGQAAATTRSAGRGENVVFVCSTGRSGSQSIARNLDRHPQISARHEPHFNLIRLSTEYAHGIKSAERAKRELLAIYQHASTIPADYPVYVESDQKLSNLAPLIHDLFPQAKFLWLIRDGIDVVASTYARGWFGENEYKPTADGGSRKLGIFHEFRLVGHLADPRLDEPAWKAMSTFERNCWYWSFWNSEIRRAFGVIDDSKLKILRLEDFEQKTDELSDWLGVRSQSLESGIHNRAKSYKPYSMESWSDSERGEFWKWCRELMGEFYPNRMSEVAHSQASR